MLVIQRPTVEAIGEEQNNRQRFAVGPLEPGFDTPSETRCVACFCRQSLVQQSPR